MFIESNNLGILVLLLVLVVRHHSISGITVTDRNYSTLLRLFNTSCPQMNGQIILFLNQMSYYILDASNWALIGLSAGFKVGNKPMHLMHTLCTPYAHTLNSEDIIT